MHRSCGFRSQLSGARTQDDKSVRVNENAKRFDYEDLDVFRRAYALSLNIHRASLEFPKLEQYELARQMRRACKSVCANIAEGFSKQRGSNAEYIRYLNIAVASADELKVWIKYCLDLEYVPSETASQWTREYQEIAAMMQGLIRSWKSKS